MTDTRGSKPATLQSLRDVLDETKRVDIAPYGTFLVRTIAVKEFIDMQEQANVDGETDEWEATRLLLGAGVVEPALADDPELLEALPLKLVRELTKAISDFSGTSEDFSEGSPTE